MRWIIICRIFSVVLEQCSLFGGGCKVKVYRQFKLYGLNFDVCKNDHTAGKSILNSVKLFAKYYKIKEKTQ